MKAFVDFMKKNRVIIVVMLAAVSVLLCSCHREKEPEEYDPYAGMVQVPDGAGGMLWIRPSEILPLSPYSSGDFAADGSFINYTGSEYRAYRGVDVSEHQHEIDWDAVASDGVEFAIIRAGYRGYSQGGLNEDPYFRRNIEEAKRVGMRVGVYFFSQAINTREAIEEANYLLNLIADYTIDLPVFFDWEPIYGGEDVRTEGVSGDVITECCLAFAQTIYSAGYEPGVYFYRSQGYFDYDLERLSNMVFWSAAIGSSPDFYYDHRFWQYSYTGMVSGIEGGVDLDLLFEKTLPSGEGHTE